MAAPEEMTDNIRKFEEIGTHPASQRNAITEAINFHESISPERKAERFRYLRKRWSIRSRRARAISALIIFWSGIFAFHVQFTTLSCQ